ncbi:unnamed protein product, partial [Polarella glacialis]
QRQQQQPHTTTIITSSELSPAMESPDKSEPVNHERRILPASRAELLAGDLPEALADGRRLWIRGTVLSRRVLSRSLAFASVRLEAHSEAGMPWQTEKLHSKWGASQQHDGAEARGELQAHLSEAAAVCGLCFCAGLLDADGDFEATDEASWWHVVCQETAWAAFPGRKGDLPIGTLLEASVASLPMYRPEPMVLRWRRLEEAAPPGDPPPVPSAFNMARHHAARDAINRSAKQELLKARGGQATLCRVWSAGRECCDGCECRHVLASPIEDARVADIKSMREESRAAAALERSLYDEASGDVSAHRSEAKAEKTQRAELFAAWLLETYGADALGAGGGVLDVAGGRGDLSWALSTGHEVPCTLVDPALRRDGQLRSWQRRALRKSGREGFRHVAAEFGPEAFGSPATPYGPLLLSASLVVGLHPDQATEAIVDLALAAGVRFAVVPCCVFTHLFPSRELEPGQPVRSLNQFCAYLRLKDSRIRETFLGFEGRNKVLYLP